jgi:hypothetical protein
MFLKLNIAIKLQNIKLERDFLFLFRIFACKLQ